MLEHHSGLMKPRFSKLFPPKLKGQMRLSQNMLVSKNRDLDFEFLSVKWAFQRSDWWLCWFIHVIWKIL